jgi:hypothetical protein
MRGAIPQLLHTSEWRGASLNTGGNFTLSINQLHDKLFLKNVINFKFCLLVKFDVVIGQHAPNYRATFLNKNPLVLLDQLSSRS